MAGVVATVGIGNANDRSRQCVVAIPHTLDKGLAQKKGKPLITIIRQTGGHALFGTVAAHEILLTERPVGAHSNCLLFVVSGCSMTVNNIIDNLVGKEILSMGTQQIQ